MTFDVLADHKRRYPEQYNHALCGKRVQVKTSAGVQGEGIVERVVHSRFGQLAIVPEISTETWWSVLDCYIKGDS